MEEYKRKRTQLRKDFTKAADVLENSLKERQGDQEEVASVEGYYSRLSDCAEELFTCEMSIRDLWCSLKDFDEKSFEADQEKAALYKSRWSQLKVRYKNFNKDTKYEEDSSSSLKSAKSSSNQRKVKMPKLEITKFNGEIKRWLLFWGQFSKIDEDDDINDSDKYQYLLQSMELNSKPRQLVESYPSCSENYKKALEALKSRYARDDVLIETYVRGLIALMQEKRQVPSSTQDLSTLYDSLQTHLQALNTLGVTNDKYASILFPMVESALPDDVLRAWNRYRATDKDKNELSKLVDFMRLEVESEERIRLAHETGRMASTSSANEPKSPTCCFVAGTSTENRKPTAVACIWCEKDSHCSVECLKAGKMTLQQKKEHVKAKKACLICLRVGHTAKRCRSSPKCLLCKKRHSTLMCPNLDNDGESSTSKLKPELTEKTNNLHCQMRSTTLLQTLVVQILSNDGKKLVRARALIDSGAQRSYITKDLAKKLNLKPVTKEMLTHCLFGGKEESTEQRHIYDISVKSLSSDFVMKMAVVEQDKICNIVPKVSHSSDVVQKLQKANIILTDTSDSPDDITLLIGADFSSLLLTSDFVQVTDTLTAIRTRLGWTLQGPVTGIYSSLSNTTTTLHCFSQINISDLWELEKIGINDPAEQTTKSLRDAELLQNFEKSIKVDEDCRYEVPLPWCDVPRPQSNFNLAKSRLSSTTNRLRQLGKTFHYDEVLQQWLELDIIEVASDQSVKGHYMPHHTVIKEASLTTKIRPVFDASARDYNGISLNSCLEKGVNLLEEIPPLLINFRKEAIGVTSDIAKAFLQISLSPSDRDYLRFLWWSDAKDLSKGTITYRHKRVVFGVASSPFQLMATINYHLARQTDYKETAMKLKRSFYVDNCVTSVGSEEELNRFVNESKEIMQNGKFDLRGWVSSPVRVCEQTKSCSVLGLIWNVEEDSLRCNADTQKTPDGKLTKRTLLSVMQRVFDPIGILCPTSIVPKIILQKTWSIKLSWDECLPTNIAAEYKTWLNQAHLLNEVTIPRRLASFSLSGCETSLHVFCDASRVAYAVCIFLRAKCGDHVELGLVLAKSRVTPMEKMTNISIPRLELIAATLGSRLASTVIQSLALDCPVVYWTDSSVVLTWIKGSGDWSVFVTNRVNEIKSSTTSAQWRHVPGNLNPADLPSRGVGPKAFLSSRWWVGPDWLRSDEQDWPIADFEADLNEVELERGKKTSVMLTECDSFLERLRHFSFYMKIVRTVGWILRFTSKRKPIIKELTYDEFERAEKTLIRVIQRSYGSKMLGNNYQTFVDSEGIIRLKTKLGLGNETTDFKFPIVLPGNELIVQRLVFQRHLTLQHAGVQTLMCNLRERFWIVGLRRLCRKAVDVCVKCKRFKAKACQPPTGSLPTGRMESSSAFEVTGVDLAGPLLLKAGSKAWIVLFTCATYRAIHLEVVESLSTTEFIMALRRFIARRGRVVCLYSDNATNFRGLDNALSTLDWNQILCFSSVSRIKWNFLPPSAPWWGGFYERLIGVVKSMLRRILGRASVKLMELITVLCDCEAIINSRPLSYLDSTVDGLRPLTPAMFIQPLFCHDVSDLDQLDGRSLNVRVKYCQTLREGFRQRFRNEYLSTLVQPSSSFKSRDLKVGEVVLIETEDRRRVNWPIGVVVEVMKGRDETSRVAKVRTASGEKVRPFQRLYPLEVSSHNLPTLPPIKQATSTVSDTAGATSSTAVVPDRQDSSEEFTKTRSGRLIRKPTRYT